MTTAEATPAKRSVPLPWAGWILTALLLAYAALLHRGIGPIPSNLESNWYNPSTFLLDALMASGSGDAMESVGSAIALLALPALATAVAVFFTTRSAVARMLSTASVIAVAVFVYYGVQAPGVWSFFHWRWSGCVVLFSLCLGAALTAPLLAESWKRRGWPLRLILYLPLFAAVVVFERNVTGTDDSLIFAISPWPVVQVFGLEVFASIIALAADRSGDRALDGEPGPGAVVGVSASPSPSSQPCSRRRYPPSPSGWDPSRACCPSERARRSSPSPPRSRWRRCAIAAKLGAGRGSDKLADRARIWALGGLLLGLPLLVGQTLTRLDYTTTRDGRAAAGHRCAAAPLREGVPLSRRAGRAGRCRRSGGDPPTANRLRPALPAGLPLPELRHQLRPRVLRTPLDPVRLQPALPGRVRGGGRRGAGGSRRFLVLPVEAPGALVAERDVPRATVATSLVKVRNAIAGRFDESRMANCMVSKVQPCSVHSFRIFSSSSSHTLLVSTTL